MFFHRKILPPKFGRKDFFCLEIKTNKNQPCSKGEKIPFFKLKNLGVRLEKAK